MTYTAFKISHIDFASIPPSHEGEIKKKIEMAFPDYIQEVEVAIRSFNFSYKNPESYKRTRIEIQNKEMNTNECSIDVLIQFVGMLDVNLVKSI